MTGNADTIRVLALGGIGDVLLTTPALRALKRSHPGATLKVYCSCADHFEVLRHNPFIDCLRFMKTPRALNYLQKSMARSRVRSALYSSLLPSLTNRHATQLIADMLNVALDDQTLSIALTSDEKAWASRHLGGGAKRVAIHARSRTSVHQQWPISNWESLIRNNSANTFVQLGDADDPPIAGAVDLRGRTSIRQAIAILAAADSFVGVVSSLAHATNAVGTRGVVLFGPSSPEIWGHPNNINISRRFRCAPCIELLADAPCPYGARCVADIGVETVEAALARQLAASRSETTRG